MAAKKPKDSSATAKPVKPAEDSTKGGAQALPPVGSTQGNAGDNPTVSETKISPTGGDGLALGGDPQKPKVETAPAAAGLSKSKAAGTPPKAVRKLCIVSKTEGFRRCGRPWSATETMVLASEFSDDEIERLKTEPELTVVEVGE